MISVQFPVRFCKIGFSFAKLTTVSVFLHSSVNTIFHLGLGPLQCEVRNDVLPCWIGPTNCQPKWLRTRSSWHNMKKNTLLTVDPIMFEDLLWIKQREKLSPNGQSRFLKTELWKLSFWFLNFEVSLVQFFSFSSFLTFSPGSAHSYCRVYCSVWSSTLGC